MSRYFNRLATIKTLYLYLACAVLILPMMALASATVTSPVSRKMAIEMERQNEMEENTEGKGRVARLTELSPNADDSIPQQMTFGNGFPELPEGCEPLSKCKVVKQCISYRRGLEGCSGNQFKYLDIHTPMRYLHIATMR